MFYVIFVLSMLLICMCHHFKFKSGTRFPPLAGPPRRGTFLAFLGVCVQKVAQQRGGDTFQISVCVWPTIFGPAIKKVGGTLSHNFDFFFGKFWFFRTLPVYCLPFAKFHLQIQMVCRGSLALFRQTFISKIGHVMVKMLALQTTVYKDFLF